MNKHKLVQKYIIQENFWCTYDFLLQLFPLLIAYTMVPSWLNIENDNLQLAYYNFLVVYKQTSV